MVETRRAEFFNKDDINYKRYTWFDLDDTTTEIEMLPEIIATYLDERPDWYQRLEKKVHQLNGETITFIKDLLRYKFGGYHGTWRKKWKHKLHVKAALKAKAERAKYSPVTPRSGDAETVDTGRRCSTDTTAPHVQVKWIALNQLNFQTSAQDSNLPLSSAEHSVITKRPTSECGTNGTELPSAPATQTSSGNSPSNRKSPQRNTTFSPYPPAGIHEPETPVVPAISLLQPGPSNEHNYDSALANNTQTSDLENAILATPISTKQTSTRDTRRSSLRSSTISAHIVATSSRRDDDEETCYTFDSDEESIAPDISLDSNGFYIPDKLYEDDQVTLYVDFTMDVRGNQQPPESRPDYVQDIVSGKRSVVTLGRPRFPPHPPSPNLPLSPVQRLSSRQKPTSTPRVADHRQKLNEIACLEDEGDCEGYQT